jgi:2-C-methyl-D-erythritol 4-phosphate cytidylyltransferase
MEKVAVIVAGGIGTRMGSETPKQFLVLQKRPIIAYTIEAFYAAYADIRIIIVLSQSLLEPGKTMVSNAFPGKPIQFISGGETRFQSVRNGLGLITTPSIVFVHDAVRCLVSPSLIRRCYLSAVEYGSAIPVVPVKDSIRIIDGEESKVVDRNGLRAVQTPQTFQSEILLPAFKAEYQPSFTDEATVVEHYGVKICLIPGEDQNIKITVPADLEFARLVISKQLKADA